MGEIQTGMTIFFMFFVLFVAQVGGAIWYGDLDKLDGAIGTGIILALLAWQIRREIGKEECSKDKGLN